MAAPLRNAVRSPVSSCSLCASPATVPAAAARCLAAACSSATARSSRCIAAEPRVPLPSRPPRATQTSLTRPCFAASEVRRAGDRGEQNGDANKAKLGKTLRILQDRLPTLLQSPLPQEILAPNISLQLFPTTHPHLPTVSGRVAYNAALWTSPIAWNRVPIFGNVKLEILAERMTLVPLTFLPRRPGAIPEQLVVRWCEKRRSADDGSEVGAIARSLWRARGVEPNKAFTGLFLFDFDAEGRILTHTIEQAQEGGNWEKGMGAKFVGLTDWLLGGMRDPNDTPMLVFEKLGQGRVERVRDMEQAAL